MREKSIPFLRLSFYKTYAEFITSDGKKFKATLETEFKTYDEVEKFLKKMSNLNLELFQEKQNQL